VPDEIADQIDNLVIKTADWPDPDQDPEGDGLLGLYEGMSLLDRGIDYSGFLPDIIWVFRQPHLIMAREEGLSRAELIAEVRKTTLHELGHHLGIDDERMHELGWD
ncbi:MAG: metallopeptidase family protein, partial [Acidimicrobiales bacterium]|nr:metallopeptidase family protein [Acidimicrobiales bacterium]